jgi:DGQHR domain-containing protein
LSQTKVNHSLVYDLFSYDKTRSPEKTAHEIAVALDKTPNSPFLEKIKRLGVATEGRFGETLSQATFVRGILPYISDDVVFDRDYARRGHKLPVPPIEVSKKLIFRPFFVKNEDIKIATVVLNYFSAVEAKWKEAWNWSGSGRILNKTTGFDALSRFLHPAYLHINLPGGVPTKDQFFLIFERVRLTDDDFTTDRFKPGSSGTGALFQALKEQSGIS